MNSLAKQDYGAIRLFLSIMHTGPGHRKDINSAHRTLSHKYSYSKLTARRTLSHQCSNCKSMHTGHYHTNAATASSPHVKLTLPLKESMMNWRYWGSTHSMHFCTTWFPFWSFTHFRMWPSSSFTTSTCDIQNMLAQQQPGRGTTSKQQKKL